MSLARRLAVACGALALCLAVLSALGRVDLTAAVTLLGNDYVFVAAIAAVGGLLALSTALSARRVGRYQARTPDPEGPVSAPTPGHTIDSLLADWRLRVPLVGRSRRRLLRARLRAAVVATLQRVEGCDQETATARVDSGAWTTDRWAGSFLGHCRGPTLGQRLAAWRAGETWIDRRVRHTVAELDSLTD